MDNFENITDAESFLKKLEENPNLITLKALPIKERKSKSAAREAYGRENIERSFGFYYDGRFVETFFVNVSMVYYYCTGNNKFTRVDKDEPVITVQGDLSVVVGWRNTGTPIVQCSPNVITYDIQGQTVLGITIGGTTFGIPKSVAIIGQINSSEISTAPDNSSCDGNGSGGGSGGGSGSGGGGSGNGGGNGNGSGSGNGGANSWLDNWNNMNGGNTGGSNGSGGSSGGGGGGGTPATPTPTPIPIAPPHYT